MGENNTAGALAKQKRRLRIQVVIAVVIALCAAYGLPHWVAEGPTVFVVVAIAAIAVQIFAIAINSYELWKLRGAASTGALDAHEVPPQA